MSDETLIVSEKAPAFPPSRMFLAAISSGGAGAQECGFCGREHLCSSDDGYWDEEELKAFRKKAAKNPDRFIEDQEYSSIEYGEIDGLLFVFGCPCNAARKYEEFIWSHRRQICDYLIRCTTSRLEEAKREDDIAKLLEGGFSKLESSEAECARLKALCELNGILTSKTTES